METTLERKAVALKSVAEAIAPHLPGGPWTVSPSQWGWPHFTDQAGRVFYMVERDGKANVYGDWKRDKRGNLYVDNVRRNAERPSIHVTPTRPAKALAGDIARRFLPAFIELWDRAEDSRTKTEAAHQAKLDAARAIAAHVGYELNAERLADMDDVGIPIAGIGYAKCSYGGNVKLELSVTPDEAASVIDCVRELHHVRDLIASYPKCARCGKPLTPANGDNYGDLCPACADATDD
jgi:hypothetical protein